MSATGISGITGSVVLVAGRRFVPSTETSYEQDMYVMSLLRESGLHTLADTFNPEDDSMMDLAQNLIVQAFSSGKLFLLLGGVLEEENREWNIEDAKLNGLFFSKLRKAEDKAALRGSIVAVLLSFLISGVLSSRTFQKSLDGITLRPIGEAAADHSAESNDGITETGTPLSENLPEGIQPESQ